MNPEMVSAVWLVQSQSRAGGRSWHDALGIVVRLLHEELRPGPRAFAWVLEGVSHNEPMWRRHSTLSLSQVTDMTQIDTTGFRFLWSVDPGAGARCSCRS